MTETIVLVTGATGYIALHVIRLLQREGYRVRGTVRSLKSENKLQSVKNLCPEAKFPVELVEANLLEDKGWTEAVKGCTYVLHVASPFPNTIPKDENEIIAPAVDGTKRVLRACAESGTVKRVVLTSSLAAIKGDNDIKDNAVYTEDDWTDIESNHLLPYFKSKTLAERAAWNYVWSLPSSKRFELAVINPALVLGPVLDNDVCTSVEIIYRMMSRLTMPMIPLVYVSVCDVRDVALAHLRAMTVPEAAGNRHPIESAHFWFSDMAKILHTEFSKKGYGISLWPAPYYLIWLFSFFDKRIREVIQRWGKVYHFDNTRMKNVLGIEPTDPKLTILDTAYSIIENGTMKRSTRYTPSKRNVFE